MVMDKDTAYRLFATCKEIAGRVPEIAPEVRDAASIFQNPAQDISRKEVARTLSEILRITTERSRFLSPANTDKLYGVFNDLTNIGGLRCSIRCNLLGETECKGTDGLYLSRKALKDELADMMK